MNFYYVKLPNFAVKGEAMLENYESKIHTKVNMTTLYLTVKYIETGSQIFTK